MSTPSSPFPKQKSFVFLNNSTQCWNTLVRVGVVQVQKDGKDWDLSIPAPNGVCSGLNQISLLRWSRWSSGRWAGLWWGPGKETAEWCWGALPECHLRKGNIQSLPKDNQGNTWWQCGLFHLHCLVDGVLWTGRCPGVFSLGVPVSAMLFLLLFSNGQLLLMICSSFRKGISDLW